MALAHPAPRTAEAAGSRSGETRAHLIDAGIALFTRHGYDGVTTRMLCERAGVNQAAIPYHFGGKERMYLALAEEVCRRFGPPLDGALARARRALDTQRREAAMAALEELLPGLAELAFSIPGNADLFALFVREELSPTAAFTLFYERLQHPLYTTVCALLARIWQCPVAPEYAHAFVGQLGSFVSARQAALKEFGRSEDYAPADVARIRAALAQAARLWARGPAPAG